MPDSGQTIAYHLLQKNNEAVCWKYLQLRDDLSNTTVWLSQLSASNSVMSHMAT